MKQQSTFLTARSKFKRQGKEEKRKTNKEEAEKIIRKKHIIQKNRITSRNQRWVIISSGNEVLTFKAKNCIYNLLFEAQQNKTHRKIIVKTITMMSFVQQMKKKCVASIKCLERIMFGMDVKFADHVLIKNAVVLIFQTNICVTIVKLKKDVFLNVLICNWNINSITFTMSTIFNELF